METQRNEPRLDSASSKSSRMPHSGPLANRALLATAATCLASGAAIHAWIYTTEPGVGLTFTDPIALERPDEAPRITQASQSDDEIVFTIRGSSGGQITDVAVTVDSKAVESEVATQFDAAAVVHISAYDSCFYGASIPFHTGHLWPVAYWTEGFLSHESASDIAAAQAEIQAIPELAAANTSQAKIEAIYRHIRKALLPHWGDPPDWLANTPGLAAMRAVRSQNLEVDCGASSNILAAYSNLAGVPTRVICLMGQRGDLDIGRHTLTEHWDRDACRWVMTDMVNGVLRIDSAARKGESLHRAQRLWRTLGAQGITPIIETSRPQDPWICPKRYFLPESTAIYLRPSDLFGGSMFKAAQTLLGGKHAWSSNGRSIRIRHASRLAGTFLMVASLIAVAAALWRRRATPHAQRLPKRSLSPP